MKKLNNKGYMLVEIILAFVIAIGITYFMIELVIKLKNKNDDLLVKTIVSTDQTIIYNTIMNDIYKGTFSCSKLTIEGNKVKYGDKTFVVSEYASLGSLKCDDQTDEIIVKIPISVKQLPEENFDVNIGLGDGIEGNTTLSCKLELTSDNIVKLSDDFSFSGKIIYQGFDSNYEGDNVTSKTINSVGEFTYYIKAKKGLTEVAGSCGIKVSKTKEVTSCPSGYRPCSGSGCECYKTNSSKVVSSTTYKCLCNGSAKLTSSSSISSSACYGECLNWYNAGQFTASVSSSTSYSCEDGGSYSSGTCYFYRSASGTSFDCTSDDLNKANDTYCWKSI